MLSCIGIQHSLHKDSLLHPPILYNFKASQWLQKNYIPTDNEIFVVSYSKTGSTLTLQLCHEIMHYYYNKTIALNNNNHIYYKYTNGLYGTLEWIEGLRTHSINNFNKFIKKTQNTKRFWKSHANLEYLPCKQPPKKMIVICRNPKDVLVSFYYHYKNIKIKSYNYTGDFDTFFTLFVAGLVDDGSYFEWYKTYWRLYVDNINNKNMSIYWLNYENLISTDETKRNEIKQIIKFIGVEDIVHSEKDLNGIIKRISMEKMKNQYNNHKKAIIKDFVRSGIVGDWKNHFSKEQNEIIDSLIRIHFNDTDFKYYKDLKDRKPYLCFDAIKSKL
eukprot:233607_1